jgi:hypothetical protein
MREAPSGDPSTVTTRGLRHRTAVGFFYPAFLVRPFAAAASRPQRDLRPRRRSYREVEPLCEESLERDHSATHEHVVLSPSSYVATIKNLEPAPLTMTSARGASCLGQSRSPRTLQAVTLVHDRSSVVRAVAVRDARGVRATSARDDAPCARRPRAPRTLEAAPGGIRGALPRPAHRPRPESTYGSALPSPHSKLD